MAERPPEQALFDPDREVRRRALVALAAQARGEPAERARVARLIAAAPDVVAVLVEALVADQDVAFAAALLVTPEGLEPPSFTAEQALEVLGRLPSARVAPLLPLLASSDREIRARATARLGFFVADGDAAAAAILTELSRSDAAMAEATVALKRLGPKGRAAVPALLAAIEAGAEGAIEALEEIGAAAPDELRKSVEQLLARAGPRQRSSAYELLARLARGTPDEILPRVRALADASGVVRAAAASALAKWDRWRVLEKARELAASLARLEDEPRKLLRDALAPAIESTLQQGWVATPLLAARHPELEPLARKPRRPGRPLDTPIDIPDARTAARLGEALEKARAEVRPDLEALRVALDAGPSSSQRAHRKLGERLEQILQHKLAPTGLVVISRATKGTESCPMCGLGVNVGSFELRRLEEGRALSLPYMAVHALVAHGMVDWDSARNGAGAVDVATLRQWIGG